MVRQYVDIDSVGDKFYYKDVANRILHRKDGPAVEWADGDKSWYINGVYIFTIGKSGNITDRKE